MTIEVRQMTIKCSVQPKGDGERTGGEPPERIEELKWEILAECRQIVRELMAGKRER